jgi:Omp85 superfamily domain
VSILLTVLLLLAFTGGPLHARQAAGRQCPDGRISFVFVDNNSIFDTSDPDLDARFRWAYTAANALHVKTRTWVIRHELLFQPGDCYDPFLLAESERLLRAYPFLSQVDIYGVPQPDGSHHVIVDTRDDWSTRVDVRFRFDNGFRIEGIRLSELNFLGTGQAIGFFFQERDVTRDYGMSYWTPQIGRTRWDLSAAGGRTRAGWFAREQVGYPFVGEVGTWAGRESFSRDEQFFDYIVADDPEGESPHVLLPQVERRIEASVLRRFGERGHALLAGIGITSYSLEHDGPVQVAPNGHFDDRFDADSMEQDEIREQTTARDAVRLHGLFGIRDIRWIKRRGLDSVRGEEDVRLGIELGGDIGRSIIPFGDNDLLLAGLAYTAFQWGPALLIARGRIDALHQFHAPLHDVTWQDIVAESELFAYLRTSDDSRHDLLFRASMAGARNTRTPFQLTLGGETGVRGYDRERFPGGRRLVLTLEDRIYLGWPLHDVMDSGVTLFADAGRMFPGDAPYGMDSGWRASAGAGLRFSFPAGSRTTYRFDVAWPLGGGHGIDDFQVRFSIGELIGIGNANNDLQFRRSRIDGVAGDLFRFTGLAGS